jgi:hypothetical protein
MSEDKQIWIKTLTLVRACDNWSQEYLTNGEHCYNCKMRDGYPVHGQPSKDCKNWKLKTRS